MSRYSASAGANSLRAYGNDGEEEAPSGGREREVPQAETEDTAMFSLEREDGWKPEGARLGSIRLAASGGGVLFLSTSDGSVIRWDAEAVDGAPELVDIKGGRPDGGRVHAMFVDPTGRHALLCLVSSGSGSTYYVYHDATLSAADKRPTARELPSLRGHILEAVAWGSANGGGSGQRGNASAAGSTSVGPFLLGTASGRVLEVKGLSGEERKDRGTERMWEGPPGEGPGAVPQPITALRWDANLDSTRHVVLVVVGSARMTRVYTLAGGPTLASLFTGKGLPFRDVGGAGGEEAPLHPTLEVARLPQPGAAAGERGGGSGGAGGLLGPKRSAVEKGSAPPAGDGFGLLTGAGVYVGRLAGPGAPTTSSAREDGVLSFARVVPYPTGTVDGREGEGDGRSSPAPAGLTLTDFHLILRYRDRLVALSRITTGGGSVWEAKLPDERYGSVRALLPGGGAGPTSAGGSYYWLVTDRAILRLSVRREGRDAWRLYLTLKDFPSARAAAGGNASRLEAVHEATAEHMFATGDVAAAAEAFARTSRPFEDTCLRLLSGGHRAALRAYLSIKLDGLGSSPSAAPQRTILSSWLLEMYLDRLNLLGAGEEYEATAGDLRSFLRERVNDLHAPTARALLAGHGRTPELLTFCRLQGDWGRIVAHHIARGEWTAGLQAIRDAPTASEMRAESAGGSGRSDSGRRSGREAEAAPPGCQEELLYRYSTLLLPLLPTLVRYGALRAAAAGQSIGQLPLSPLPTGTALLTAVVTGGPLRPLLPSLELSEEGVAGTLDAVVLYLEWLFASGLAPKSRARARPLHNLLLSLYAGLPTEDLLHTYVEQELAGSDPALPAGASAGLCTSAAATPAVALSSGAADGHGGVDGEEEDEDDALSVGPRFDVATGLRVSLAAGPKAVRTTVRLYCALGLYIEAVEAALAGQGDVELAKSAANAPPREADTAPLRKRLWVRIATHVIGRGGGGAAGAIAVLHESGVLAIEDVLAYFPGSTTLGEFKEEVTESLRSADAQIARLRTEMRGYTQAAERIRSDIKALRSRCGAVRPGQRCEACKAPVLSRHCYLFPCGHAFHSDCLMAEAVRHMTGAARRRLAELTQTSQRAAALVVQVAQEGIAALSGPGVAASLAALRVPLDPNGTASAADVSAALAARAEEVQAETDAAVAGECLLCGDAMVESIAVPLGQQAGETFGSEEDGSRGYSKNGTDEDWAV